MPLYSTQQVSLPNKQTNRLSLPTPEHLLAPEGPPIRSLRYTGLLEGEARSKACRS